MQAPLKGIFWVIISSKSKEYMNQEKAQSEGREKVKNKSTLVNVPFVQQLQHYVRGRTKQRPPLHANNINHIKFLIL